MAKYSFEFKIKVVKEYLSNEGSYEEISKKYSIPSSTRLRSWVKVYKELGEDSLKRSRKKTKYTYEFKKNMVELYLTNEISYSDLAVMNGINNSTIIATWVSRYRAAGFEGLMDLPKGRPLKMGNKSKEAKEVSTTNESVDVKELKALQDENLRLRIENAYLKELRRLRLEELSRKKEKQESSTASEENSN